MKINLSPVRQDETLEVMKQGSVLRINGESFDFASMPDGATLPSSAINSDWFFGPVEMLNGELVLTLLLPNPWNYSPEQAFPAPLLDVPDGVVSFPKPLPLEVDEDAVAATPKQWPPRAGVIDWAQLITAQMKASAAAGAQLAVVKAELAEKNAATVAQMARIQDRVDTLGYGIDAGEATEEDEEERAQLLLSLAQWKSYKFALGKVTKQSSWPATPAWPTEPVTPVIEANPLSRLPGAL